MARYYLTRRALRVCKRAELNVRTNFLPFTVRTDEYAHRLGSNLHANYYISHYYNLSRVVSVVYYLRIGRPLLRATGLDRFNYDFSDNYYCL